MPCNACQTKFSLFRQENGCPKCGFSYCSKCLKYKYNLPNIGERKICGRCYNKILQTQNQQGVSTATFSIPHGLEEPLAPIDITKKMESLENPARPPIIMYKQNSNKLDKLLVELDPVDQEIVNRLKKLKDEDKQITPPTEDEIRRRLALLKDQDPQKQEQSINIHEADIRTNEQKADDLISEYLDKLEITKSGSRIDIDIQARLDSLRGIDTSKYVNDYKTTDFDEDDEQTATKKIIEKALAEAALESKYSDIDDLEDADADAEISPQCSSMRCTGCTGNVQCPDCFEDNHDEYLDHNSCVMCEQTADLVVCKGCTGDLYCSICFKDNHDDFEMQKHKTVPFISRKLSE